jgi:hypothetical protein
MTTAKKTITKSGQQGGAYYETKLKADGTALVRAWRDYPAGVPPATAQRVWQIAADFGAVKTIFPLLLSVYVTYPDATTTRLNTARYMTFPPPDPNSPLSPKNPLFFGIEQLVELDDQARRLTYISPLGMPVKDYQSVMQVTGEDACRLTWTSTFATIPGQEGFVAILAGILAGGANQIAAALGLK